MITFSQRLRLRALVIAAACVAHMASEADVAGQTIELTREIEPPALAKPSLAASLVTLLEREAGELKSNEAAAVDSNARIALEVRANWRLLSAELLAAGDREGAAGSVVWVKGLKLAVNRDSIDQAVSIAIAPDAFGNDAAAQAAAIDAMASFNRGFADHVQDGGRDGQGGDSAQTQPLAGGDWMRLLLARLIPIVSSPNAPSLRSPWVASHATQPTSTAPVVTNDLAVLRARVSQINMDETARGHALLIIEFLERGQQFAELGPRIEEYQRVVEGLLDSSEAIAATAWLTDEQRAAMSARLAQAIAWFQDSAHRQQGIDAEVRLQADCRVIAAIEALARANVQEKALREVLAGLQKSADEAKSDLAAARMLNQASTILVRMATARTLPPSGLARELRIVERDLQKEYRACEAKVLAELARGALLSGSMADPSLSSLLADHRERVEDLERLRHMPEWSAAINQMYPPAAKDFDTQMRKRAQALLEPTKRGDSRLAFDRFEAELGMFEMLPFEKAMRDGSAAAVQLTGGLNAQLIALITDKRRAWADAWSRMESNPEAAKTMLLLRQLTQSLRDAASLAEIQPATLNRWPAWQVSVDDIDGGQSDVVTRLRLACAAAAAGDLIGLAEQTNRMEQDAPLAKLAGRLMHVLGNDLRELPDGAAGVLAQLTIVPADDALLLKHRDDLAKISRYSAEGEHARGTGQAVAAKDCQEYVNALATRLLGQFSAE